MIAHWDCHPLEVCLSHYIIHSKRKNMFLYHLQFELISIIKQLVGSSRVCLQSIIFQQVFSRLRIQYLCCL